MSECPCRKEWYKICDDCRRKLIIQTADKLDAARYANFRIPTWVTQPFTEQKIEK